MPSKTVEERFWEKVAKRGPNDCWEWQASRDRRGYGRFAALGDSRAYRVSYILNVGPIPDGLCVLHRCDNPPCVNPAHLELGTRGDNVRHRVERDRSAWGSQCSRSRLLAEQVLEARLLRREGWTYTDLAKRYGVRYNSIRAAVCGDTWSKLTQHLD